MGYVIEKTFGHAPSNNPVTLINHFKIVDFN